MKKILIFMSFLLILLSSCTPIDSSSTNQVTQELSWHEVSQENSLNQKVNIDNDKEIFSLLYLTLENLE